MISKETYDRMKELITEYEKKPSNKTEPEKPYLETLTVENTIAYNPKFGDNKECECGHTYYRHFDSYENMDPVGCKYCECFMFREKKP